MRHHLSHMTLVASPDPLNSSIFTPLTLESATRSQSGLGCPVRWSGVLVATVTWVHGEAAGGVMSSSGLSHRSRSVDVHEALQRAKRRFCELQLQVQQTSLNFSEEASECSWTPSKELRDSLVDMYRSNPGVNEELRRRLPSPSRQNPISADRSENFLTPELQGWPEVLQELPVPSCSSSSSSSSPGPPLSSRLAGQMEVDSSPSRGTSPGQKSSRDPAHDSVTPAGRVSPALGAQLDSPAQICAAARPHGFDGDKNVSLLLKELDALREVNNKLQEQLAQKEKELHVKELDEELKEEQREAQGWDRATSRLEEVLEAQKDRDQALMSRLLLANEERDEALLRVRRLQQAAESENVALQDTNTDLDELLRSVCQADSVQEVRQFGSVLVQQLLSARQRRSDITAQEMKAVMEERDKSVVKWKRLEEELLQQREQLASQEELLRLQLERDAAVEEKHRLEAEIRELRANHRLQDPGCPSSPTEAPPLLLQLQQLSKEKQNVEAELQRCQKAELEACERVRRLERLVEVLRRKVGTGSLRAVT
ncbi:mirror-image polydactyly gene 1 protein isoform X1 [Oryzias latipes]|uniref:mirror-image polydactyly gene 1 protein isoform X1 n=2 Tax=Oryzias latipes TaxID=8090 RepID=UPI0009D9FD2F|nr:mirror-image polydactyly gene 1 protein isoform X1 [Oryzias latipes]